MALAPFLLVSDLHASIRQMAWVEAHAEQFGTVVVAGDMLDVASTVARGRQEEDALRFLERLGRRSRVVACTGNHDLGEGPPFATPEIERGAGWLEAARGPGTVLDGGTLALGNVTVTSLAWLDGPGARAATARQLAAASCAARDRRWVWVHHAPPRGTAVAWNGRHDCGEQLLRDWIEQYRPDAVLAGHVHQAPFVAGGSWRDRCGPTWTFNAGQQIGPVPAHVVLDLGRGTAEWTSLAGRARTELDAAR